MFAPVALVVGVWGCAGVAPDINNAAIVVQSEIRALLDAGEITVALARATSYERRSPGPESWSLLGRALWRSGELLEAESFYRRAASAGSTEGTLGLARAAAALGRFDEARSLAEQLAADERTHPEALRVLAAVAWRRGNSVLAAEHLSAAAEASRDAALRARLSTAAAAAATMPQNSDGPVILWRGSAGTVPLERDSTGAPIVVVQMGGVAARLRLSLLSPRSTLSPELVGRVGLVVHGDSAGGGHAVAPVELGGVEATAVPFVLQPLDGAEGELGFDVISTLDWELWLSDDRMVVRPPHAGLPAGIGNPGPGEFLERGRPFLEGALADTHPQLARPLDLSVLEPVAAEIAERVKLLTEFTHYTDFFFVGPAEHTNEELIGKGYKGDPAAARDRSASPGAGRNQTDATGARRRTGRCHLHSGRRPLHRSLGLEPGALPPFRRTWRHTVARGSVGYRDGAEWAEPSSDQRRPPRDR